MVRATRSFLCQRTGASRGLLDVFKIKKLFYLFLLAAYDAKFMSPATGHEYLTRLLLQDSPPAVRAGSIGRSRRQAYLTLM